MDTRQLRGGAAALVLAAAVVAAGCATGTSRAAFEDNLRRYNQYVRWSDFERASQFVVPDAQADFRARGDALAGVRFTDYEVRSIDVDPEGEATRVEVRYSAYRTHQLVEVDFVEEQEWAVDEATGTWRVRSVLREEPTRGGAPF